MTPTRLRDVPTLDSFLHDLPLLFRGSIHAWFPTAVEDIRVDTRLLDKAKAAGYSMKVLFISTEDGNLNVGRVLLRISRGGQAVPLSSVIYEYLVFKNCLTACSCARMANSACWLWSVFRLGSLDEPLLQHN